MGTIRADYWLDLVAKRFSTNPNLDPNTKRLRQTYDRICKKRADLYQKYIAKVDAQVGIAFTAIKDSCGHPLEYIKVEHRVLSVGNEYEFSVVCKNCGAKATYEYCLRDGWKDEKLQSTKLTLEAIDKFEQAGRAKKSQEEEERALLKRLQEKYA